MAQNFRTYKLKNVGTSAVEAFGGNADSYDAIVGIRCANTTSSSIYVDAYITNSSVDYYLLKEASIPAGSSLEIISSGSKVVVASGDSLKVKSDTATSMDCIVSTVDAIST